MIEMSSDPTGDPNEISVDVPVGRYRLDVGAQVGTGISWAGEQTTEGHDQRSKLLHAIRRGEHGADGRRDGDGAGAIAAGDAERAADTAERVTGYVDHALKLFKEVASGSRDVASINDQIDAMLACLQRLHGSGRLEDELRLARALSRLLAVALRWLELLRSLRGALEAAKRLRNEDGEAWALHELGTLHLGAGKVADADEKLTRARDIRARVGDRRALAVTERNLRVLCQTLREILHERPFQRLKRVLATSPALAALGAAVLLVGGGVAGAAIGSGGPAVTSSAISNGRGPTTPTTTRPGEKIVFNSPAPPAGSVNRFYRFTYRVTGDKQIRFSLAAGRQPEGLSLSPSGVLTGVPHRAGTYTFTVTAKGTSGATASRSDTITIHPPTTITISFTPGAPPRGTVSQPYSFAYSASGDKGITYTTTAGRLPAGLSLSSAGTLSGTPRKPGDFTYAVTATGASGASATRSNTVTIALPPITFASNAPPSGTVGAPYSFTYDATGDTGITYRPTGGQLPPGLSLSPTGMLSGHPQKSGDYQFTVMATGKTGATGSDSSTITITSTGATGATGTIY